MKPINPTIHGYLDYMVALLLIAGPFLFGFDDISGVATRTMVVFGIVVFLLSIVTNYPVSAVKAVPFRTHGILETIGAVFLLASPWLLGYNDVSSVATNFAVIVSIAYLGVVALTDYRESYVTRMH